MRNVLLLINIVLSITITVLILVQGRGGGLGGAWGGGGETFHTRRGIDKITLRLTIILIVVFFLVSAINLFLRT
ncbi:MAG: preprotein translocase subunit SecG [Microgenomates group bacterium]|jgi:protein translocase SecG subunit|nr:preprotein translocase subunit SecG [Candidatus Woesebacteria bacterium]MBP6883498.1 preprotein translocase subunit SecG [Candidatus Woesebacteria bacterium]